MDKNKKVSKEAQGADLDLDPSLETVENWVRNDLARCISFLNAIHSDPDLCRQVAAWMKGRLDNSKLQKAEITKRENVV